MKIWLDDERKPWACHLPHGGIGWTWVKSWSEFSEKLDPAKVAKITSVAFDHDLEHPAHLINPATKLPFCDERTGWHCMRLFLDRLSAAIQAGEHIELGSIHIHTLNDFGRARLLSTAMEIAEICPVDIFVHEFDRSHAAHIGR